MIKFIFTFMMFAILSPMVGANSDELIGDYQIKSYKACMLSKCSSTKPNENAYVSITSSADDSLLFESNHDNSTFVLRNKVEEKTGPGIFRGTVSESKLVQTLVYKKAGLEFKSEFVDYLVWVKSGRRDLAAHKKQHITLTKGRGNSYKAVAVQRELATAFPLKMTITWELEKRK